MDAPSIIRLGCAVLAFVFIGLIVLRRKKEGSGPDLFEYALMMGFIAVAAVGITHYGPTAIQNVYAKVTGAPVVSAPEASKDDLTQKNEEELRNAKRGDLIIFQDENHPLQPKICMFMHLESGDGLNYICFLEGPSYDFMSIPRVAQRIERVIPRDMDNIEYRNALDLFMQR